MKTFKRAQTRKGIYENDACALQFWPGSSSFRLRLPRRQVPVALAGNSPRGSRQLIRHVPILEWVETSFPTVPSVIHPNRAGMRATPTNQRRGSGPKSGLRRSRLAKRRALPGRSKALFSQVSSRRTYLLHGRSYRPSKGTGGRKSNRRFLVDGTCHDLKSRFHAARDPASKLEHGERLRVSVDHLVPA